MSVLHVCRLPTPSINWGALYANRAKVEAMKWKGNCVCMQYCVVEFIHLDLPPIKKNFYHEDACVQAMTDDDIETFRFDSQFYCATRNKLEIDIGRRTMEFQPLIYLM